MMLLDIIIIQVSLGDLFVGGGVEWSELYKWITPWKREAQDSSEIELTVQPVQDADCESRVSFCMLYTSEISDLIQGGVFTYRTFPPAFIISVLAWLDSWGCQDQPVYNLYQFIFYWVDHSIGSSRRFRIPFFGWRIWVDGNFCPLIQISTPHFCLFTELC